MKKILILTSFVIVAVLIFSGCKIAQPVVQPPDEQLLITQYSGIINEVKENGILVYVFEGYNGEMIAKINEETKIDESLVQMIKPDNLFAFKTNGIMTKSIPPKVIIMSIDTILEGVVFEGIVSDISKDVITVDITYPRTDKIIIGITPEIVFAEGVSNDIKVGNIIRFETTGIMTLSEPPRMNVVRFTKNEFGL